MQDARRGARSRLTSRIPAESGRAAEESLTPYPRRWASPGGYARRSAARLATAQVTSLMGEVVKQKGVMSWLAGDRD